MAGRGMPDLFSNLPSALVALALFFWMRRRRRRK
jgi:hypothetical protein